MCGCGRFSFEWILTSLLTKQVKEDCIWFKFFLQWGKSQGKSITQHLAL